MESVCLSVVCTYKGEKEGGKEGRTRTLVRWVDKN